jgi:hypothetical protein
MVAQYTITHSSDLHDTLNAQRGDVNHPLQTVPRLKKEYNETSILPLLIHGRLWDELYILLNVQMAVIQNISRQEWILKNQRQTITILLG